MVTHELKTDPEVFSAVSRGDKKFEIRIDDRDFKTGDILHLRQTQYTGKEIQHGKPLRYTGRECYVRVTHILRGPIYGLSSHWCIMSITDPVGN